MNKLWPVQHVDGATVEEYWFHCPGCQGTHWIRVNSTEAPSWTLEGGLDRPTVSPSILVRWDEGEDHKQHVCHSFIRDGQIQYLSDCTHALAGQTVDLPTWED
jgi:hypothetical protein